MAYKRTPNRSDRTGMHINAKQGCHCYGHPNEKRLSEAFHDYNPIENIVERDPEKSGHMKERAAL